MSRRWIHRRVFRPRKRKVPPFLVPALVVLGVSIGFFRMISAELRPIIKTVAISQSTNLMSTLISSTVDDCLSANGLSYSDFITMETDGGGKVTSLTGMPAQNSRFKRQVLEILAQRLEQISADELSIPIGTLTGKLLLSGVGPNIRVKVHAVGDVTAQYRNAFQSAGVNQTHHGVYLDITATVYLLIPGEIIPVTVTDSVCVAETIILGEVPSTYIHMDKGES